MTEETKHEKFLRMRDSRVPKATHSIELLANLASHHYESSGAEARELVISLSASIAVVAEAFGVPYRAMFDDEENSSGIEAELPAVAAPAAKVIEPERQRDDVPAHLKPWPEGMTKEEDAHVWRISRELDRAINAIQDRDGAGAIEILTGLTTA